MTNKRIELFIAVSLDGYIADGEGSVGWLEEIEGDGDNGYTTFLNEIDTVVMGHTTYKQLFTLTDTFPYSKKHVYVFSNEKAGTKDEYAAFVNGSVKSWLENTEGKSIWLVGGAQLVKKFLDENQIDRFIITVAPIILGDGIPLFEKGTRELLHLEAVEKYGQFTQMTYRKKE
ncbi:dihydrofolate reductase [Listeria rocourtiae]|uniref:dihydrofolate reductase family protein n=1 Tax=Listeria rocourtiae TaxID=647910 RepID=UPI001627133E|nr:dihydrofolate reductase family protein [Listeria rocourtiae]MBC1433946.1 dihydrofolate reductase [Listeria rocourtiae]